MATRTATAAAPEPEEKPSNLAPETDLAAVALHVFNEDWQTLTLEQKIARIAGHVGALPKTGWNAFHKYNYIEESALVSALRQYLSAAGIVIIPDVEKVRLRRPESDNPITEVLINYIVTDGKERFSFHMPGHGADKGDKGVYKAITGSMKYALMKLFKIETGDDPEADTRVDERAATSRPVRPVAITSGSRGTTRRGGHTEKTSAVQLQRISELVRELGLNRPEFVAMLNIQFGVELVLPDEDDGQQRAILDFLRDLTTEDAGKLITNLASAVPNDAAGIEREPSDAPYG